MNLDFTSTFHKNAFALREGYRLIVNQGGTWSSKTWSVIQLLCMLSMYTAAGLISVVSESLPHQKRGCIRDFKNIMAESYDDVHFNKSDQLYTFPQSQMEFFGADDSTKMRGGRRNILFLNEVNNITLDSFNELDVRTKGSTICDFNPVAAFYIHELLSRHGIVDFTRDCFPAKKDICFIHSTYLDAKEYLPQKVLEKIESRRDLDLNWWRVYGLGLVGKLEGLVHPSFSQCDELPLGEPFYGMDFGYTNDPTTLIKNVVGEPTKELINGKEVMIGNLYSDELIYRTGLNNQQICEEMRAQGVKDGYDEIFADAAEPKSIDEIHLQGFNIKPAPKGPDSIVQGIQKVNQYRQHWTKRSLNGIKEQRNYRYVQDKDGKYTNKPSDSWNHAMDARRYGVVGKLTDTGTPGMFVL